MSPQTYGMSIDLALCIGCNACVIACKQENEVSTGNFNTWVDSYDVVVSESRIARANVPKQCNHCEVTPCIDACPVGATYKTEDGVVLVDEETCIGCAMCVAACPYGARYMTPDKKAGKCTFCYHRATKGMKPACVSSCVTGARVFGDLEDKGSLVNKVMGGFESRGTLKAGSTELAPHVYYAMLDELEAMSSGSATFQGGKGLSE